MVVIIDLDVLEDLSPSLHFGAKTVVQRETFGFETTEERFGIGVIVAVAGAAHALDRSNDLQGLAHRLARLLATPVGMKVETRLWLAQRQRVLEGRAHQLGA